MKVEELGGIPDFRGSYQKADRVGVRNECLKTPFATLMAAGDRREKGVCPRRHGLEIVKVGRELRYRPPQSRRCTGTSAAEGGQQAFP